MIALRNSLLLIVTFCLVACSDSSDSATTTDSFDRAAMLESWADNQIIPGFKATAAAARELDNAVKNLASEPTIEALEACHRHLRRTILAWQRSSMYQIGKAETLDLQRMINTYPTNAAKINEVLAGEAYNLNLISSVDQQGLQALDYLLHGVASDIGTTIEVYQDSRARDYLMAVSGRITQHLDEVVEDWDNGYRAAFVSASSAGATGSVDLLVNDYIEYYERRLRAGKLGIPAGVFSDQPLPDHVESVYQPTEAKELLLEALAATKDFFNGISQIDDSDKISLADYLDYLDRLRGAESLSAAINAQLDKAISAVQGLDDNLQAQIQSDNVKVLEAYNELQRVVPLIKIDMVQSMGISIDFVDTDGD